MDGVWREEAMGQLTIYDIAKLAGVSITTVSRVLNGSSNVGAQTRAKVEEVIHRYGYVPRQEARNFGQQKLYAVGLLMDDIRHSYMAGLAYAINQELNKWKVNTVLCNLLNVEEEFIGQMDDLIEKRVNGVILLGSIFQNGICRVTIERRYAGFPFVAVNGNFLLPNVYEVIQNESQGIIDAVTYLYKNGRRKIGWVYSHKSGSDLKKYTGFIKGMKMCGLSPTRLLEVDERSLEEGNRATAELLARFPDTDAVIYSADILAVGGAHYCNDQGIAIPQQIALVGFNNSNCARECWPPLTSVDNRLEESGRIAARTMLQVLNKQPAKNVVIPCGLSIRQST